MPTISIPEPNEGDKLATRIWLESYDCFLPMGDVATLLRVLNHTETELAKLRERVRELEMELRNDVMTKGAARP